MRFFSCSCGNRTFFDNTTCLRCGRDLGYLPDVGLLSALEQGELASWRALAAGEAAYRKCANYGGEDVCNWMVALDDDNAYCLACRLSRIIPDLSHPENRERWFRAERAKRRLIYTLLRLSLPVVPKSDDPGGIAFDLKAATGDDPAMIGHAEGLITLNIAEADPVTIERSRTELGERYRTLLGHFRHESGHYYWGILVGPANLNAFRSLFGDERADYGEALAKHYASQTPHDPDAFISGYASAHPWEDWAETWAHYLHLVDTLETARAFANEPLADSNSGDFGEWLRDWADLTIMLNELNQSMGLPPAYPFEISPRLAEKLRFVHESIPANRNGLGQ